MVIEITAATHGGVVVLTHFEAIVGILAGIVAILAAIGAGLRMLWRASAATTLHIEAMHSAQKAITENTTATEHLSEAFTMFSSSVTGQLTDHEVRIVKSELRLDHLEGKQP